MPQRPAGEALQRAIALREQDRYFGIWVMLDMIFTMQGDSVGIEVLTAFHTPTGPAADVEHHPAVVYGTVEGEPARQLSMAVYSRSDTSEKAPIALFVHGGGWAYGHPAMHTRQAEFLAANGFVTAAIFYRLTDEATWPAPLEDVQCAVRWLRANAASLGADPDRIAVLGASAGGHLAALAALAPELVPAYGGNLDVSSRVQAAVCWYPPVKFGSNATVAPLVEDLFQGVSDAEREAASPLAHVSNEAVPPLLVLTGERDDIVPVEDVREFVGALDAAGAHVELEVFDSGHGFDLRPSLWQQSTDRALQFLRSVLIKNELA